MKMLFIHPFLFRYARGIERYTLSLSNAMISKSVDVSILTWNEKEPYQLVNLDHRVRVYKMPNLRFYMARTVIPLYWWHLQMNNYDKIIIHFAGYGEAEAIALTNLFKKIRYDIVFHYPYTQVPHRYREFFKFNLAKNAGKIISVSNYVADGVKECFGRESSVIGHGVDTVQFVPNLGIRERIRRELGLSPTTPILLTAAALEERKGIQWVLQALPQVLEKFPNLIYLILGEGPHRSQLEALVTSLSLESHVRFLGNHTDIELYYQSADIALLLSYGEASSLTSLECLACELPIIVSHHPPFDELLQPQWGIMVNELNTSEVAFAIQDLLENPDLRKQMGRAGRGHILAKHSWGQIAEQYLALFPLK